jgi:osmotically-inducible protein OsmY
MKFNGRQIARLALCVLLLEAPVARPGDETVAETLRARTFVRDSVIGARIRGRLDSADKLAFSRLHVDMDTSGVAWLRGVTRTLEDAQRAIDIARGTDDVKSVNSRIRIEP